MTAGASAGGLVASTSWEIITKERVNMYQEIRRLIDEAESHSKAYFFNPPRNASSRRSYEKKHSVPEIQWQDGSDSFTAEYVVRCTCGNVYARGYYTRNGKKTTLTAIKNSYKRLTEGSVNK